MPGIQHQSERGFVLATALVMLSMLTLLAIAMFFTGRSVSQVSGSVQHSAEGHYYAETAVNYMIWATRNDAEFDAFDYRGSPVNDAYAVDPSNFPALTTPSNAASVGDWSELTANLTDPGPIDFTAGDSGNGVIGQVMYFDNTPLANRALVWPLPTTGSGSNITTVYPTLNNISTRLPRYIRLDIASDGTVTPSIPKLPHANPPVVGKDIPDNGAVVWLTTGNADWDFQVDSSLGQCSGTPPTDALACDMNPGASSKQNTTGWLRATGTLSDNSDQYGIVVYAVGYVGGKPNSIIRAQIK